MKTMILTTLIVISQVGFAKVRESARVNFDTAIESVEKSASFKKIEKLKEKGEPITNDPKLALHVEKTVEARLKDIVAFDNAKLMNLIGIDAKLTLAKIFELSSIVTDPNANKAEIAEATKALELLFLAGDSVKMTFKNKTEENAGKKTFAENVELSEKVASFVNVKGAEKFVVEFKVQLEMGKTASQAITTAGKGAGKNKEDITEEQIRNCKKG